MSEASCFNVTFSRSTDGAGARASVMLPLGMRLLEDKVLALDVMEMLERNLA